MKAAIRTRMKVTISITLMPPPRLSLLMFSNPKFEFFVSLLSVSMESATSVLLVLPIAKCQTVLLQRQRRKGGRMKSQEWFLLIQLFLFFQKKMVDNGELLRES